MKRSCACAARAAKQYPMYIDGKAVTTTAEQIVDTSPIDTSRVLGTFHTARPEQIDLAVKAARAAAKGWASLSAEERIAILRRAAELIRERKFELAAIMSVEVGKSRLESMGDAEESADLIDYYCQQMQDAHGFTREMARMTPIERNVDVLRPFGVFACIAPFNFPLALSAGMSSAALVAGNTIVYKPAEETPWTGLKLYEIYRDAGVPTGVFNLVQGYGHLIGDAIWRHPGVDGVVFTGSKEVGMRIFAEFSAKWARPCLLELGGKNAAIVMDSADIDMAAEGVMKSAFGLQNQKCSATSRVYVHKSVAKAFTDALVAKTEKLVDRRSIGARRVLRARDQQGVCRAIRARSGAGEDGGEGDPGRHAADARCAGKGALCFTGDRAAAAREHALSHRAVCAAARDRRGLVVRGGDRGEQSHGVRAHGRHLQREG